MMGINAFLFHSLDDEKIMYERAFMVNVFIKLKFQICNNLKWTRQAHQP